MALMEIFGSSLFLGWEEEFKQATGIPLHYLDLTCTERPQIIFDAQFVGVDATRLPQCSTLRGNCSLTFWIKVDAPASMVRGKDYGVDIFREKLISFFHKKYKILPESIRFEPAQLEQVKEDQCVFVHEVHFQLKPAFELVQLEKEPKE